jgi:hypothetical protein
MSTPNVAARFDHSPGSPRRILDHYAKHSPFSDPGRHAALLSALPSDPAGVARAVQGLVIYEHVAQPFYNCLLSDARRGESHIRPVENMIDTLLELDDRPLDVVRPPERRLVGICRHFMLLAIAIFRQGGVPARGRGGFGAYFNRGKYEDHWVCEYWKADEGRWALLDAQCDDIFVRNLAIRHDIFDTPRDQFLTAADAWRKCRSGELDPKAFGIEFSKLRGLWFVAGNLIGDAAALNGCEVLPWDVWGAKPGPEAELSADQIAYFDELALLTSDPDANFEALGRRFAEDDGLRLPKTVFNALRQREEPVFA